MRKLCAARRAVEDVFGISSANPFGTHCDVHGDSIAISKEPIKGSEGT
jgi:hypothetical protein